MKKCILNLDERNSVKFVKELETIKIGNKEECKIILPNNITCTPFGMLLTSSAIKKFREKNKDNKFNFEMDRKGEGVRYAGHMGFFKNISEDIEYGNLPGEALGSNNYIPITKVDFKNYSKKFIYSKMLPVTYIEFESKRLAKVLARENNELLKLFTYLIRSLLRPTPEFFLE